MGSVDITVTDMCIEPMDGPFGATVKGIDLTQPLDDDLFLQLARGLRDHHILVIENQNLDKAQYLAFGKRWGQPISFFKASHREAEFPELIIIHNRPDTPEQFRNGARHWHVDSSYESPPAAVTVLYAVEAPSEGNETVFVDMSAAYDALSEDMKVRIESLVVRHGVGDPRLLLSDEYRGGQTAIPPVQTHEPVEHPLVMRHPQTKRKVIYAPTGSAFGIAGMETEEALALLRELKIHSLQPRFEQRAAARTGSVLIWDNHAVMHSATDTRYSDKDGERRLLYRISTRDSVPL